MVGVTLPAVAGSQIFPLPVQAPCHAAYENSDDSRGILNPRSLRLSVLRFLGFQPEEGGVPPPYGFTEKKGVLILDPKPLRFGRLSFSVPPLASSLAVSISDVETVREGHESELLRSLAEEFPLEQGFTVVFHGRRSNLDLVANSVDEARIWMQGLQLLVDFVTSMDQQEWQDQYQQDGVRVGTGGH